MIGNETVPDLSDGTIPNTAVGTTVHISPRHLHTFHRNPHHGDVGAIMASLLVNGQYKPIVANLGTYTGRPNEVLAGNHTLAAFLRLNEQDRHDTRFHEIAVHVVDVDDDMANRIVLVDNRSFELGSGTDVGLVLSLIEEVGSAVGTGYTTDDLDRLESTLDSNRGSGGRGDLAEPGADDSGLESDSPDADDGALDKPVLPPHREAAIGYTIVFDTESQQKTWFEYVKWLKIQFPDPDLTLAERVVAFLEEMPPERRI